MTKKTYPVDITNEISAIAAELATLQKKSGINVRTIAQFAGISINSVKSALAGKTANIATYVLIAKAMGTTFTAVVQAMVVPATTTNV